MAHERNADLDALRRDYEAGDRPLAEVCDEYGISLSTIRRRARAGGWRPRSPRAVDREGLIGRLFYLLERKIDYLEKDMDETNAAEAAELGRMVASLDKLIAIDDAERARRISTPRAPSKAMLEIRARVAERLAQLGGD